MEIELMEEWVWRCAGDMRLGTALRGKRGRVAEYSKLLRTDELAKL